MSNKFDGVSVDMDVLKSLVPAVVPTTNRLSIGSREERVGGEAWHGSVAVITDLNDSKRNRGSPVKQVVCALFGNMGTINTGMMFGFSAVTIPQLLEPDSFIKIDQDQASWIASLSSIGTPVGCIISGYLLDVIGRKKTIITTLIPMILGWYLISAATNVEMIYCGRLLVGLGSGLLGAPSRVYTAEVTQPHLRGMLAAVASVGVSLGVTIEYVLGAFLSWPKLAFISGLIPTVALIASFFLPESPSWLLSRGFTEPGRKALQRLRGGSCDIEAEIKGLVEFAQKNNTAHKSTAKETLASILHPSAIKPFFILSSYFLIYQFSGVNPVTFYAVEIFQESGADMDKYLATILLGLIRLGFTIVSCILMRRCGRRPLTFISSVFCGLSMLFLGGYMYKGIQWKEEGLTHLPHSWFPVFNIFLFIASSTIGYLVVPWVMIGELYPVKVRGIMGGLTTFCGHFCVFVVVKTFPLLQRTLTKPGSFWFYGTVSLVGTIFFYIMLPETKGRTLQEIEDYFSGRTKTLKPVKDTANNNNKAKANIVKSPN
uniref:Major facilitator superfamily (MFS) profile domain-containing protein n=2 Tax=Clastoptera arizonana TaxID=38151 RepID=A0A1B6DH14_9HEMI